MTIDTVLFDLDDTLCDQRAARWRAQQKISGLLTARGVSAPAAFWEDFDRSEPALFRQFADGEISKDDYRLGRFSRILPAHLPAPLTPADIARTAAEANTLYLDSANSDIELFDDALPALDRLDELGVRAAVFTNGPSDGQRRKLRALGLDRRITDIFISEELGHAKPAPESFAAVLTALGVTPDRVLMVGDSPDTDIAGAHAAGVQALLLNRHHPTLPHSDTLTTLRELGSHLAEMAGTAGTRPAP